MASSIGINYFGGKRDTHLPFILPLIDGAKHKHYVEPFFGCGGVFFNKQAVKMETLNDIDDEIVNFFTCLRDKPKRLIRACSLTPYARTEFNECKAAIGGDEIERARRFVFLIMGSVMRTHLIKGTSFSRNICGNGNNRPKSFRECWLSLHEMADRMTHAYIENKDGIKLITKFDERDVLLYIDPPYLYETRTSAKESYRHETTIELHRLLCGALNGLKRARFVLSGYDSPLYVDELSDFNRIDYPSYSGGISKDKINTPRREVLWTNLAVAPTLFDHAR